MTSFIYRLKYAEKSCNAHIDMHSCKLKFEKNWVVGIDDRNHQILSFRAVTSVIEIRRFLPVKVR